MKYLLTIVISCTLLLISCNKACEEAPVSDCEKTEQHQNASDCCDDGDSKAVKDSCCCCDGETEGCEGKCADCNAKDDCVDANHECCEGDTTKPCCGDHECGDKEKK